MVYREEKGTSFVSKEIISLLFILIWNMERYMWICVHICSLFKGYFFKNIKFNYVCSLQVHRQNNQAPFEMIIMTWSIFKWSNKKWFSNCYQKNHFHYLRKVEALKKVQKLWEISSSCLRKGFPHISSQMYRIRLQNEKESHFYEICCLILQSLFV